MRVGLVQLSLFLFVNKVKYNWLCSVLVDISQDITAQGKTDHWCSREINVIQMFRVCWDIILCTLIYPDILCRSQNDYYV